MKSRLAKAQVSFKFFPFISVIKLLSTFGTMFLLNDLGKLKQQVNLNGNTQQPTLSSQSSNTSSPSTLVVGSSNNNRQCKRSFPVNKNSTSQRNKRR